MTGMETPQLRAQLTERDHAVLTSVETYRLLTSRHLQRLHFDRQHPTPVAAARACNRALSRLRDLGIVRALERRVGGIRAGSAGFVWYLGPAGERLLDLQSGRRGRRNFREPSRHFVEHTLAVADLAVQTIERTRSGELELLSIDTEPRSWQQSLGPHGTVQWLKPDLRLVTATPEFELHHFVELDLATEHLPVIERQCRAYLTHRATGRYQTEHGLFPSVLWVTPTERRAQAVRRAIDRTIRRVAGGAPGLFQVCTREQYAEHMPHVLTSASEATEPTKPGGQEGGIPS